MKKSALAIVQLCIVSFLCYGQINGLDLTTAIPLNSVADIADDLFPYEQIIDAKEGVYFMSFKQTPAGYERCLDRAKRILSDNGKSFSKDRIEDEVMYPPNIKGLTDYQNMAHELMMSRAEVSIVWKLTDAYHFRVLCNNEFFAVFLIPSDVWDAEIEFR